MNRSPRGPRKTVSLSHSVHHKLNMYALAASAARVSALHEGALVMFDLKATAVHSPRYRSSQTRPSQPYPLMRQN
jgi:hypothetical protein